jgi:hypothetical protein
VPARVPAEGKIGIRVISAIRKGNGKIEVGAVIVIELEREFAPERIFRGIVR